MTDSLKGVDGELLYPAIHAIASNADGTGLAAKELQSHLAQRIGGKAERVRVTALADKSCRLASLAIGDNRHRSAGHLRHGALHMASGKDWLALLGPDKEFVPIESWGSSRSPAETARVNGEWDKITSNAFWKAARDLHFHYHAKRHEK